MIGAHDGTWLCLALLPVACEAFGGTGGSVIEGGTGGSVIEGGAGADSGRPGAPKTCRAIRDGDPHAVSGVFKIAPDPSMNPFDVWCDMARDDGGWTLLITLARDRQTLGIPAFGTLEKWPETFALTGEEPTKTGMYKGSLTEFSDVREEVAISQTSGGHVVYGTGKTPAELDRIRKLYAYEDRATIPVNEVPDCGLKLGLNDIMACTKMTVSNAPSNKTFFGWQWDIPSRNCWFGRGACADCTNVKGGSSRCMDNTEPDNQRWARTFFR